MSISSLLRNVQRKMGRGTLAHKGRGRKNSPKKEPRRTSQRFRYNGARYKSVKGTPRKSDQPIKCSRGMNLEQWWEQSQPAPKRVESIYIINNYGTPTRDEVQGKKNKEVHSVSLDIKKNNLICSLTFQIPHHSFFLSKMISISSDTYSSRVLYSQL